MIFPYVCGSFQRKFRGFSVSVKKSRVSSWVPGLLWKPHVLVGHFKECTVDGHTVTAILSTTNWTREIINNSENKMTMFEWDGMGDTNGRWREVAVKIYDHNTLYNVWNFQKEKFYSKRTLPNTTLQTWADQGQQSTMGNWRELGTETWASPVQNSSPWKHTYK